jgi:hypothetical protein
MSLGTRSLRSRWRRPPEQADLPLPEPDRGNVEEPGDTPVELRWWQRREVVAGLAALCVALLIAALVAYAHSRRERAAADQLRDQVRQLSLRPTSVERKIRITPNTRSWSATPDATIRYPDPPELLQLHLPVGYAPHAAFAVVIEKVDHGRLLVLQRVVPDSNRDLRVALNSSAFGPGEYRIRLQGYTWRGTRDDIGWARLVVD